MVWLNICVAVMPGHSAVMLAPESSIVIESTDIAADLVAMFTEGTDPRHTFKLESRLPEGINAIRWTTQDEGETVTYDVEPLCSPWLRLWRAVLCARIPEHML